MVCVCVYVCIFGVYMWMRIFVYRNWKEILGIGVYYLFILRYFVLLGVNNVIIVFF